MRVLDKTVQMNEEFKPVLLITLELPLTLNGETAIAALKEEEKKDD